jgi:hypothetical protein
LRCPGLQQLQQRLQQLLQEELLQEELLPPRFARHFQLP